MQNRNYLLFFAILVCGVVKAQNADTAVASVHYSFTHIMDTTQPENPLKENMILYLGKNMSNYTSYDKIERAIKAKANAQNNGVNVVDIKDIDQSNIKRIDINNGVASITTNTGAVMNFIPAPNAANSYFKNQTDSKLSYIGSGGGKLFSVEEKIPAIEWNISQETKTIQGMQCQKATGDFKGRTYEAWFCSQLPYSNGPWKLGGLPGLIVEASDTKKEVVFEFSSFENATGAQTAIVIPPDAITTTPKEYKQYLEATQKNMAATTVGSTSGGATVTNVRVGAPSGTVTVPDGKPMKIRRMNNPIERADK